MSLNLHLLRMFAAVVRTGSFSRAAELLNISQPAISKGVRDFELQVGCRLLNRSPKGVVPTAEGLALGRAMRGILRGGGLHASTSGRRIKLSTLLALPQEGINAPLACIAPHNLTARSSRRFADSSPWDNLDMPCHSHKTFIPHPNGDIVERAGASRERFGHRHYRATG